MQLGQGVGEYEGHIYNRTEIDMRKRIHTTVSASDHTGGVTMAKRWYQDRDGGTSTMRIITMVSSLTGCVAVAIGALTVIAAMWLTVRGADGMIEYARQAIALAGLGAGMTGLGEIAKSWQAKSGG